MSLPLLQKQEDWKNLKTKLSFSVPSDLRANDTPLGREGNELMLQYLIGGDGGMDRDGRRHIFSPSSLQPFTLMPCLSAHGATRQPL